MLDGIHIEIGGIGRKVDEDDGDRADDDRARKVALRIRDLAGGKRVGEAVVGPEHRNKRQAEEACLGGPAGGVKSAAEPTAPPPSAKRGETRSASAPNLAMVDAPAMAAPAARRGC